MENFVYAALFRTLNITNKAFVTAKDDWRVELFHEERKFNLIDELLIGRDFEEKKIDPATYVAERREISVGNETPHLLITVNLEELTPEKIQYASDRVDEVCCLLGLIYNASLVGNLVFRNCLAGQSKMAFEGHVPRFRPFEIDPINTFNRIVKLLDRAYSKEDGEALTRLLSRYYSRFRPPPSTEQQFLDLWLILDIFPMKGAGNSGQKRKTLAKFLAGIVKIEAEKVEEKLKLKHLENVRGHLTHHGTFEPKFSDSKYDDVGVLMAIVDVALREFFDLPYEKQFTPWLGR